MVEELNWSLCCLCQVDSEGEIRCPAQSKRKDIGAGYESLSHALSQLVYNETVRVNIPESLLNEPDLNKTLILNRARYHKSCLNKLVQGKRPHDKNETITQASPVKTRKRNSSSGCSGSSGSDLSHLSCLFCGIGDAERGLHSVSSTDVDSNIRAWATNMKDFYMLGKLSAGDLFAQGALYHKECMTKYYTQHRSCLRKKHNDSVANQSELEDIALAEIVSYVIEGDSDGPFYITDLAEMYKTRLTELGGIVPNRIHSSRFQNRILSQIPWMTSQKESEILHCMQRSHWKGSFS